jgi:hypothetical protein
VLYTAPHQLVDQHGGQRGGRIHEYPACRALLGPTAEGQPDPVANLEVVAGDAEPHQFTG